MAAQLIMPTLPADQQQSRHFLPNMHTYRCSPGHTYSNLHYRPHHDPTQSHQVSPGPQVSPLDTSAVPSQSPTCSTPPSPTIQLKYCRPPLYMPAVLRRCDEFPPTEVTRCRTAGSTSSGGSDSTFKRANNILMSIPGLSIIGQHLARRPSCEKKNMTLEGDWKLDSFPQVDGMPTRKHWKVKSHFLTVIANPDSESTICDDPGCRRTFNYFVRRHHCRKCGDIFCDWHSSATLPLDQNAEFNPRAEPSRTCNYCFNQVKSHHKRNGSQSSSSTIDDVATPATPLNAPPVPGVTPPHKREVPASASREWNWSTF
ncbi:hypothetical protein E4U55_005035 [Claviceps digitariae]|nr:hypothetical protein E4U55_005035 [Claviceps digitariae]